MASAARVVPRSFKGLSMAVEAVLPEPVSTSNSLLTGKRTGNLAESALLKRFLHKFCLQNQLLAAKFPAQWNREFFGVKRELFGKEQGIFTSTVSVHFLHTCFGARGRDLFSLSIL
ncbi:MAG: hypothetical protein WA418_34680 [Bradyrhizobium sp.]